MRPVVPMKLAAPRADRKEGRVHQGRTMQVATHDDAPLPP